MCGGMAWHIISEFFYGVEGGVRGFEEVEVEVETIISLFSFFFIFGVLGQHMLGM